MDDTKPYGAVEIAAVFCGISMFTSVFMTVSTVVEQGFTSTVSLGGLIAPFVIGAATAASLGTYSHARAAMPYGIALIATVVVVAILAGVAASIMMGVSQVHFSVNALVMALPAVVAALMLVPVLRFGMSKDPSRVGASPGVPLNDPGSIDANDEWCRQFVRSARTRGKHTEREIQTVVSEARNHARATGESIGYTLGEPQLYARRLPPNRALPHWRSALTNAVGAVALAGIAAWSWSGGSSRWLVVFLLGSCVLVSVRAMQSYGLYRSKRHAA